ncbi:small subunit of serine palmitoyltransferase-like protein [Helicostylum pulchrum]|nr:small subunit of serine palmitoyltransferase-like protein [Helicostylum pulchrum]
MESKHKSSFLSTKLYQYELQTALYMLEPWEKALFNTIVLSIVSLSVITMYQYTPVLFKLIA